MINAIDAYNSECISAFGTSTLIPADVWNRFSPSYRAAIQTDVMRGSITASPPGYDSYMHLRRQLHDHPSLGASVGPNQYYAMDVAGATRRVKHLVELMGVALISTGSDAPSTGAEDAW